MSEDVTGGEGVVARASERESSSGRQIVDLQFLRELLAVVDESGIDSLEISRAGTRIRVAKTPAIAATVSAGGNHVGRQVGVQDAAPAAAAPSAEPAHAPPAEPPSNLIEVTSPMVGTFYRAPAPEAPSYVEIGSKVVEGQTLCILEAMKLMNELDSEVEGVVREICVENSEPVEYGQVLFRIEPVA